jgi:methionine sulfoxide reductase heme-binding subunit
MSIPFAAAGPSAYWYLARGTGVVSLLLLTASVVLGVMGSLRFAAAPRWPRFTIDTLHREVSLLVLVLLAVHIVTSVLDSFAPVKLTDAVIPFVSSYRPLWLGLGALSFDLLLAVVVTSLARRRLGYRTWRAIHWFAYASWPVAVLHGLGTGSDTKVLWMLALTAVCVGAVMIAILIRIAGAETEPDGRRGAAIALTIATTLGIVLFTLAGPLQHGWARRAGTPSSLLPKTVVAAAAKVRAPRTAKHATATLKPPFSARITGRVTQSQAAGGAIVDLALRLSGGADGKLRIRLAGAPIDGGGLSMTGSQVDLLAAGLPSVMEGRIVSLQGQDLVAHVAGAGSALDLHANLSIDQGSGSVTGTLSASAGGGG